MTDSDTELLVPYRPGSHGPSPGTLIPANLASAAQTALERLQHHVGDIDEFVQQRLGYASSAEMFKVLYAEQIDSAAFAFWQRDRGKAFLNADQTGNGKGRWCGTQVIDIIRQGQTAVWITQQPDLYAAALADLADLGKTDLKVFVTNNSFALTLPDGRAIKTGSATQQEAEMRRILAGEVKYDLIFSTYSQLQTVNRKEPFRREFFKQLAPSATFILDEAHQGGGQTGERGSNETTRSVFVRNLIDKAAGVVFATATPVKDPDVLDLYARRTDAIDVMPLHTLQNALHDGGIPLQQMITAKFAEAGQMLRRERSYEGVKLNLQSLSVNREAADQLYACMGAISRFEIIKDAVIDEMREQLKAQAKAVLGDSATGDVGARSTNFTSLMHNVVSQSALGLVADAVVEIAIAARAQGQKPVIACVSTMESHLSRYSEEQGIQPGDVVNLTYADLLRHNLERSREVRTKDFQGECKQRPLTNAELGVGGVAAYQEAMTLINSTDLSSVPISFIDYVKERLEAAGMTVGEITGRKTGLDYSSSAGPVYVLREGSDTTPQAKVNTVNGFNNGQIDALIINSAGFTGISIQSSDRFADQAQRHLIVAQIHSDINQVMQMFGRVNRFGQVNAPEITVAFSDLPASRRIAALLSERMARLNANTTAARESALSCVTASQFFSPYGEAAIDAILKEYPEYNYKLAYPRDVAGEGELTLISRVTGRMPLMPIAEQETLYRLIDTEVAALIELDKLTGHNPFAADQLDLNARTLARVELVPPTKLGNVFGGAVYAEVVDAKRPVQPMTQLEVVNLVRQQVGLSPVKDLQENDPALAATAAEAQAKQQQQEVRALSKAYRQELKAVLDGEDLKAATERLERYSAHLLNALTTFPPGTAVELRLPSGHETYGVVGRIVQGTERGNPLALSNWRADIYTQDFARTFPVRMSAFNAGSSAHRLTVTPASMTWNGEDIYAAFDSRQGTLREERVVLRGNLLSAHEKYPVGNCAYYSTQSGERLAGMIMPQGFNLEQAINSIPVVFHTAESAKQFLFEWTNSKGTVALEEYGILRNSSSSLDDLTLTILYQGGSRIYRSEDLIELLGQDFYSTGIHMQAEVSAERVNAVLNYLMNDLSIKLHAADFVDVARERLGQRLPEMEWLESEETLFQPAFDFASQTGVPAIDTAAEEDEIPVLVAAESSQLEQPLAILPSGNESPVSSDVPLAAASISTAMGNLKLEIFVHDADYLRLECSGTTANWADYPQTTRIDFVPWSDLAEMEAFSLLSQYAGFAVQQVHQEFMQQLGQEMSRIAPDLQRWLKANGDVAAADRSAAFWEQYPNRERSGFTSEFMQLAMQTVMEQLAPSSVRAPSAAIEATVLSEQNNGAAPIALPVRVENELSGIESACLADSSTKSLQAGESSQSAASQSVTIAQAVEFPSCANRDSQQWNAVREALLENFQLSERYVDILHERKLVDSDTQGNIMFLQHRPGANFSRGEAVGVALYSADGQRNPSAASESSIGYFWFQQGKGVVQEVVVVATGIDAVAFALSHERSAGGTVYLALDGQKTLPSEQIQAVTERGGRLTLGEGITLDTSQQGCSQSTVPVPSLQNPTIAISKPAALVNQSDTSVTPSDRNDPITIQQIRQWYRQAGEIGRSENHLNQIAQVGKSFLRGEPLSEQDMQVMTKDRAVWREQVETIAQQARFILAKVGDVQAGGILFEGSKHYSLFARDDQLYILATNRGVPPAEEDRQILPESVLKTGRGIILKTELPEGLPVVTQTNPGDRKRFEDYSRWVHNQAAHAQTASSMVPNR